MAPFSSVTRLPGSLLDRLAEALNALIELPRLLAETVDELRRTREEVARANAQIERQVGVLDREVDVLDRELDVVDEELVPVARQLASDLGRFLEVGNRLAVSLEQLASGMEDLPFVEPDPDELPPSERDAEDE